MKMDQPRPGEGEPEDSTLHVAVIMDGNGRWAKNRGWPRLVGHRKGAERARELVEACPRLGIRYLTIYAFSTENWTRTTEEVLGLMSLFGRYIKREANRIKKEGVRMRFIGDRGPLDPKLKALFEWIETETAQNDRVHLTVAINYGGRDEIRRATQSVVRAVQAGELDADAITDQTLSAHMDTAGLPDPDLVVRTSGETRVSNYLLWQAAYSEYIFTPVLWPDFTPDLMASFLDTYKQRDRRFGAAPV